MLESLKKILFSTKLTAVLFILFATAMALGTFIESWYSTETARIYIYNATWFEVIMVFFVINFIGNIQRYRLWRWEKWPLLALHLSWILIIIGAGVTRYISFEGMMPIREGASERAFYSDKTYLTVFVDGDIDGTEQRKTLEQEILVTEEGKRGGRLPWKLDFNGQRFQVRFKEFIRGVEEGLIPDPNGTELLKIVEAGDGQRHEHYLESGQVSSIHNVLFALNKPTPGAINISTSGDSYRINSPFAGGFMRMADQFQGIVQADSTDTLQLRSLYNLAGMQFVIPEEITRGKYGIVELPEEEITDESQNALVLEFISGGQSVTKKIMGSKGRREFSDPFTVGGLEFSASYGSKLYELPFSIRLNDFIAEKYPGTERSYSAFKSKITVEDERSFDYEIFMNNVLDHRGYRFFQASFHPDEKGTVLSVNHDAWGTWISYIGYFLLYIGLMGLMFYGKTRFKELANSLEKLKKKKKELMEANRAKGAAIGLALLLSLSGLRAQEADEHLHGALPTQQQVDSMLKANTVDAEHADLFGSIVIQDDEGRMKPINTFSSELLRKLSFKNSYKDLNPDQVLLAMMLNPALWSNIEFIALDKKAQNDSIRSIIGVEKGQEYVKVVDFFDAQGNYKLRPFLMDAYATNTPNKFQQDFKDVDLRLGLLNRGLSGEIVKIFPLLNDPNNKWISALEFRSGQHQVSDSLYANFINSGMPYYLSLLQRAVQTGDYTKANEMVEAFKLNQRKYGEDVMPSEAKIKTEIRYNKMDIFNKLYRYYALFGLLLFIVLVAQIFKDRKGLRIAIRALQVLIVLSFVYHTVGLILRWYISGHAPWSDAYESIIYVGWATMIIALILGRKSNLTLAASTFVASLLLWIAHQNWVDPSIANLQPVLDSYWLMIHVAVIVGSYGPLTIGMILGVVALILILLTNEKNKERMKINLKEITIINELALTIGLVMLTIGNFLGGQWANESWGRYWGWDPKETWALISIMIYAFVLHMRLVPALRGQWLYNFASIVAFASIMMTYFGVNFYLVGLHSYASGDQVITPAFVWYTVLGVFLLGGFSLRQYRIWYR
jgi:cytochrome c-type biogenesis protein CcsB